MTDGIKSDMTPQHHGKDYGKMEEDNKVRRKTWRKDWDHV